MGWSARKLGLATNSLTAVELVDAKGAIVRADAETNPQLFWAVRGGGGSFGVVTALEFRMFDFTSTYGGMLVWDVSHAEDVLRAWAAWAVDAPDEVTTSSAEVRGSPATVLETRDRTLAAVVWVADGTVTAVAGSLDADELLTVARDLR